MTRSARLSLALLVALAALAFGVAACGPGSDAPEEPTSTVDAPAEPGTDQAGSTSDAADTPTDTTPSGYSLTAPSGERAELTVDEDLANVGLAGTLRDADGAPLADTGFDVVHLAADNGDDGGDPLATMNQITDGDGAFTLELPAPGLYAFSVDPAAVDTASVTWEFARRDEPSDDGDADPAGEGEDEGEDGP